MDNLGNNSDGINNNSPTKNNYSIHNQDEDSKILVFHTKVGKSYKNHGWSLSRQEFLNFLPLISYEEECDAIIDGIPTKAKLNIMPRIFYSKQSLVKEHLTRLHKENFQDQILIKLILNKELNTQKIVKTNQKNFSFQTKVGKSYKSHGWTIPRNKLEFLIPKTSYEEECDLIIDGIPTKGRLNILFRLFYKRNLAMDNHLKEIHAKNPSKQIDIVLLLNHKENSEKNTEINLENFLKNSQNKSTKPTETKPTETKPTETKPTELNENTNKNSKSLKMNYIIPKSNKITCIICGKTLKKNRFFKNSKGEYSTICKKCYDKNVAAQYLVEILDYIKPNKVFNPQDLINKGQNFNSDMITTLKEENIIITKLGTNELRLESKEFIDKFLESYGNNNLKSQEPKIYDNIKSKNDKIEANEENNLHNNDLGYYKDLNISDDGILSSHFAKINLNISDIINLYENYKIGKTVNELCEKFNISKPEIERIIFIFESNKFDKLIQKWQKLNQNKFSNPYKREDYDILNKNRDKEELIKNLTTEVNKLQSENNQLKSESSNLKSLENSLKILNETKDYLTKENNQLINENKSNNKIIQNYKNEISNLNSIHEDLINDIETLKGDNSNLSIENNEFKGEIFKLNKDNNDLVSEIIKIKNKFENINFNVNELSSINKMLKDKNGKLTQENSVLNSNISTTNKENKTLKTKIYTVNKENKNLKKDLSTTNKENKNLKKDLSTTNKENKTLKINISQLENKEQNSMENISNLITDKDNLNYENEKLYAKNLILIEENENFNENSISLTDTNKDLNKKVTALTDTNKDLNDKIQNLPNISKSINELKKYKSNLEKNLKTNPNFNQLFSNKKNKQIKSKTDLTLHSSIMCPNCHKCIPKTSRFCQYCGAEIESEKITNFKKCPNCGHLTKETDSFCTGCGKKL